MRCGAGRPATPVQVLPASPSRPDPSVALSAAGHLHPSVEPVRRGLLAGWSSSPTSSGRKVPTGTGEPDDLLDAPAYRELANQD